MRKIMFMLCLVLLAGCGHKKPELSPTQTVDGKSIIVPPEFDVIPESAAPSEE